MAGRTAGWVIFVGLLLFVGGANGVLGALLDILISDDPEACGGLNVFCNLLEGVDSALDALADDTLGINEVIISISSGTYSVDEPIVITPLANRILRIVGNRTATTKPLIQGTSHTEPVFKISGQSVPAEGKEGFVFVLDDLAIGNCAGRTCLSATDLPSIVLHQVDLVGVLSSGRSFVDLRNVQSALLTGVMALAPQYPSGTGYLITASLVDVFELVDSGFFSVVSAAGSLLMLAANEGSTLQIVNTVFQGNEGVSLTLGGTGVSEKLYGDVLVDSCAFVENEASAIVVRSLTDTGRLAIKSTEFRSNVAGTQTSGAALKILDTVQGNVDISVANSVFTMNIGQDGGAIHVANNAQVHLQATQGNAFMSNVASNSGGAIFVKGTTAVTEIGGSFHFNAAINNGGALAIDDAPVIVDGAVFDTNGATEGKAVHIISQNADVQLKGSLFRTNDATTLLASLARSLVMKNNRFQCNGEDGPGLRLIQLGDTAPPASVIDNLVAWGNLGGGVALEIPAAGEAISLVDNALDLACSAAGSLVHPQLDELCTYVVDCVLGLDFCGECDGGNECADCRLVLNGVDGTLAKLLGIKNDCDSPLTSLGLTKKGKVELLVHPKRQEDGPTTVLRSVGNRAKLKAQWTFASVTEVDADTNAVLFHEDLSENQFFIDLTMREKDTVFVLGMSALLSNGAIMRMEHQIGSEHRRVAQAESLFDVAPFSQKATVEFVNWPESPVANPQVRLSTKIALGQPIVSVTEGRADLVNFDHPLIQSFTVSTPNGDVYVSLAQFAAMDGFPRLAGDGYLNVTLSTVDSDEGTMSLDMAFKGGFTCLTYDPDLSVVADPNSQDEEDTQTLIIVLSTVLPGVAVLAVGGAVVAAVSWYTMWWYRGKHATLEAINL